MSFSKILALDQLLGLPEQAGSEEESALSLVQVGVEWFILALRCGVSYGHRDAEDGVSAKPAFVRSAVQIN